MHNIYQMLLIVLSFEWLQTTVYKLAGAGSRSSLNGILTDKIFDSFPACLGLTLPYVECVDIPIASLSLGQVEQIREKGR